VIRITNLHKSFGAKKVLQGLSLEIAAGETHAIIGRSGDGKSVLLKHICALLAPDSGEIEVAGRRLDLRDRDSVRFVRSKVGMVFQYAALFDSMSVRENIGFALDETSRKSEQEIDQIVARLLDEVNLPGTEPLLPAELSGGMRKRIGLARALAPEPEIILYDEPTTGLDPVTTDIINALILQTQQRHGVTSIVVTHDMKSAYKVGNRISMLYEGKILFTGTPRDFQETPNPYVRQFVDGLASGPITDKDQEQVLQRAYEAAGHAGHTKPSKPPAQAAKEGEKSS